MEDMLLLPGEYHMSAMQPFSCEMTFVMSVTGSVCRACLLKRVE